MRGFCTLLAVIIFLTGCSDIGLSTGSSPAPNEARPSGKALSQGQFSGLNGKTVTGGALIFLSGSSYILRIEGLTGSSQALSSVVFDESSTDKNAENAS